MVNPSNKDRTNKPKSGSSLCWAEECRFHKIYFSPPISARRWVLGEDSVVEGTDQRVELSTEIFTEFAVLERSICMWPKEGGPWRQADR